MTVSCEALVTCVIFLEFRSAPRHTFASTAGFLFLGAGFLSSNLHIGMLFLTLSKLGCQHFLFLQQIENSPVNLTATATATETATLPSKAL